MAIDKSISSYIVRIYRYEKDSPHNLVGMVEAVETNGKQAFIGYDGLWDILNSRKKSSSSKKKKMTKSGELPE